MPANQKAFWTLLLVLIVLGLVGGGWLGTSHLARLFFALLVIGLSAGVALLLAPATRWGVRLAWVLGGLAVAALAWWFVPTSSGVSLFRAHRYLATLESLPAGEVAEYVRDRPLRKALVRGFPLLEPEVAAAEKRWLQRTVDAAIEEADEGRDSDPAQASMDLRELALQLSPLEHFHIIVEPLREARLRAFRARLTAVRKEIEGLLAKDRLVEVGTSAERRTEELRSEAQALDVETEVTDRLLAVRRLAFQRRLDAVQKEVRNLLAPNRAKAAALAEKAAAMLRHEAEAVGMQADLEQLLHGIAAREPARPGAPVR
jgi:hypothetical protein